MITVTPAVLAALQKDTANLVRLVDLDLPGGAFRAWDGKGNLTWGGKTFAGLGHVGSISKITRSSTVEATGVTLTVAGVDAADNGIMQQLMEENYQGAAGKIWVAVRDDNDQIIPDPILVQQGLIDNTIFEENEETGLASVNLESELRRLNSRSHRRYTDSDQKDLYPGDTAFLFIADIQDDETIWGIKPKNVKKT